MQVIQNDHGYPIGMFDKFLVETMYINHHADFETDRHCIFITKKLESINCIEYFMSDHNARFGSKCKTIRSKINVDNDVEFIDYFGLRFTANKFIVAPDYSYTLTLEYLTKLLKEPDGNAYFYHPEAIKEIYTITRGFKPLIAYLLTKLEKNFYPRTSISVAEVRKVV